MKLIEKVRFQVTIRAAADALGIQEAPLGFICPFHEDRVGTLLLREQENRFQCTHCGASGTQIDLVARVKGLTPDAAVTWLAERFDIQPDDSFQEDLLDSWKRDHAASQPTLSSVLDKADNRQVTETDQAVYRQIYAAASTTDTASVFLAHKGFSDGQIRRLGFRFLARPRDVMADLMARFGREALDHAGLLDRNREFVFQQHALLIPFLSDGAVTFLAGWDMSAGRHPIRFPHGKTVPPYVILDTENTAPVYITEDLPGAFAFIRRDFPAIALSDGTLPASLLAEIRDRRPSLCGEQSNDGNQFNRKVLKTLQEAHVDVRIRETAPAFEDFLAFLVEKRK